MRVAVGMAVIVMFMPMFVAMLRAMRVFVFMLVRADFHIATTAAAATF